MMTRTTSLPIECVTTTTAATAAAAAETAAATVTTCCHSCPVLSCPVQSSSFRLSVLLIPFPSAHSTTAVTLSRL